MQTCPLGFFFLSLLDMGIARCSFHLQRTIIFDLIMHGEPGSSLRLCVFTVEGKLARGQRLPSSSVVVRGLLKAGAGVLPSSCQRPPPLADSAGVSILFSF